ncbi:ABC transporter permease [Nocardia sp. XZ_19_385]|uniref:ABC transporter permease n=1 Tax=Nocardia sp. XZ_19_385 TaxID=2769488 RepID=UPI0018909AE5|nr:FtsX-like permease family protein [Nocardia sp. XZ_19_385]
MIGTLALRGLWARKSRLVGSFLAVFLGVSFLSGGLMLADTLQGSVDRFLDQAYSGTDVLVRNSTEVATDALTVRGSIDSSVLDTVRATDGVAVAVPLIQAPGQLLGKDGVPLDVQGPRLAGNWVTDPGLNPYHVVEGRTPSGPGEVVINKALADLGTFEVGDTTAVLTTARIPVTIVGLSKFGSQDGFGGSSFIAFGLAEAQQLVAPAPDRISSVAVRAASGVSDDELVRRLSAVLSPPARAVTGEQVTADAAAAVDASFIALFRTFLLVFAGIALLVGTFTIANTFSIIVAQQAEESAMLRAIGATRRQVLGMVVVEALTIGTIAASAGVLGGAGFTVLLKLLFSAFGLALPADGLAITPVTVVIALAAGIGVTLLACVFPALRASRIPPITALRMMEIARPAIPPARRIGGLVLAVLAAGLLAASVFVPAAAAVPFAGLAAIPGIAAMVLLGPDAARWAAAILGAPAARLRPVVGKMARRNATRNPRRTAGAATALMIGVAAVTVLTLMSTALKTAVTDQAERAFGGDLALNSAADNPYAGYAPRISAELATLPEVGAAVGIAWGNVLVDGRDEPVSAADPTALERVLSVNLAGGSLADLSVDQLAVDADTAAARSLTIGSPVAITLADGTTSTVTVGAIYQKNPLIGSTLLHRSLLVPHDPVGLDRTVLIDLRAGVDITAGRAAVEQAVSNFGAQANIQDRTEFAEAQGAALDQQLAMVYVMLALTILISLLSISNTLALAVYERIREFGLFRAVGATRKQIKSALRWESAVIAAFGTFGGMVLGAALGWALSRAVTIAATGTASFTVPAAQLALIVLVGLAAGVIAAIRPARRAARIPILEALARA